MTGFFIIVAVRDRIVTLADPDSLELLQLDRRLLPDYIGPDDRVLVRLWPGPAREASHRVEEA